MVGNEALFYAQQTVKKNWIRAVHGVSNQHVD